jgi:cell fate regulator YaaT (PSP1 superfamily)
MNQTILVRYGAISEVSRFCNASGQTLRRGESVVLQTHRGIECGVLLEDAAPAGEQSVTDGNPEASAAATQILRMSTEDDRRAFAALKSNCEEQFAVWQERIRAWSLQLELIDIERTLDETKLILYVLNDRGPECTRLALLAAAAGLGIVEVQSVGADGLVAVPTGGGCGSGGCGSGGGSDSCCH